MTHEPQGEYATRLAEIRRVLDDPEGDAPKHLLGIMTCLDWKHQEITVLVDFDKKEGHPGGVPPREVPPEDRPRDMWMARKWWENTMITINPGGEARLFHRLDGDWNGVPLDAEQQETLGEYVRRAIPTLRTAIHEIQSSDEKATEEELDRMMALEGTHQNRKRRFRELLRRAIVMQQSLLADLREMELEAPEADSTETALHCLYAAARLTGTDWELLEE